MIESIKMNIKSRSHSPVEISSQLSTVWKVSILPIIFESKLVIKSKN